MAIVLHDAVLCVYALIGAMAGFVVVYNMR